MTGFSAYVAEVFTSWSTSVAECFGHEEKPRQDAFEKSFIPLQDQPVLVPPPTAERRWPAKDIPSKERAPRRRAGSSLSSFSVRKRLLSSSSSTRRPQISAPSDFRHVQTESFQFPSDGLTRPQPGRRMSFRPLQLSIYEPNNQLSPILPLFDEPSPPVTPPQRAITYSSPNSAGYTMSHTRSISSMSFHLPRKQIVSDGSVFESPSSDAPRRPPAARTRAYTTSAAPPPLMDDLVERIATAMLERDRLQQRIDDVVERQSIYISSRPSTAYGSISVPPRSSSIISGRALDYLTDMEPMPEVPALPPNAPSFSERLSSERPITASSQTPVLRPGRAKSHSISSSTSGSPSRRPEFERGPQPPLPLRLRPPLRKKKSFSRVSTWLFPGGEHQRDLSLDSVTNMPKPIHENEGFYQVEKPVHPLRTSSDTYTTVSDWTSTGRDEAEARYNIEEEDEEDQTIPTSASPASTPVVKLAESPMERRLTFGGRYHETQATAGRTVGVAF